MKTIKHFIPILLASLMIVGCDEDFVEVNTDPYAVRDINPALLFAGAQRSHLGNWTAEHTIVQQFVIPYNQGATLGFNFNEDIDGVNNPKWNESYPSVIRSLVQAIDLLGEDTDRTNLLSMIRIWKAQVFMGLVDTYGDVPYSEAGKAVGDFIYFPSYDDDEAIYEDLYKEITSALAALTPSGDFVSEDLFYGSNSSQPTNSASAQVEKWRKLGNSLLLRLGMRYSKVNPSKAESIVSEAFSGGVMTSNADNAYVKYDGNLYVWNDNNTLRDFSQFNYAAEPLVDQLKATDDPRAKYMIATYEDPGSVANDPNPDTDLANQFGVPIGVSDLELSDTSLGYRGPRGGGLDYSQINILSAASPAAPAFYVTYGQTSLLLAEAAFRGWISGNAQAYYEEGIRANMDIYSLYPNTEPIPTSEVDTYLAEPEVAYNASNALELINTQYWLTNFRNGTEAFANVRRSGFPDLARNDFNDNLLANGGDGYVHRMTYPDREGSANSDSYTAAVSAIGGDNLVSRVFWDVE
ncbi:SusD/RagB family nutrient-binding outer membrane lipoprotein [Maribacter cobaltidurans]|uniref:SusD/RagB family nutrient-binding outer membrane lipoprotein n=1 Tax=Maribacter cobaltidurans TaxID=1178778 RepID=A0A223VB13_9FLAO|nr:SusD/RagB family nutrient-binding outer membrane lipoprotein [Maribacter cobaltidurans]ASV32561.1 SusD/RagB family nutrient-binding outer membrane lipoprotein [Maribacter cobaltidurans]